jgi:glycosyltransferase involved in cell wall biosynthesis
MKEKKTILFPFVGDSIGGSQIASRVLISNLKSIQYNYEVLIFKDSGGLSDYLSKYKIKFTLINNRDNDQYFNVYKEFIYNFFYVRDFLKEKNISIVHTNDLRMHYLWSLYSIINKFYHIWHQHSAFYSRRNIFFSSLSKRIITVSNYCKESFTTNMSKRSIVVGNPFESYSNRKKTKSKNKIVSYIGNSNSQKRAKFFVEIAKNINKKNKKIFFHMLGDTPFNTNTIESLKKYNIRYFKRNYEIESFLRNSSLLVAPAVNEGFGRTLIEAMLLKVPILASDSGAHNELILNNKNGLLAKPDNLSDFSAKMLKLLSDDNKKRIDSAFNFSRENFNIKVYLNKIKYLYDEVFK